MEEAKLFGLDKTNRDFSLKETWGKNQFNSSFPASLCCYLASKNLHANYLCILNNQFFTSTIAIDDVFGINTNNKELYFAFEAQHTPFQRFVVGTLPRTDLVIQKESTGECLQGLEVKLTALPDHATCDLDDDKYGSELVVRPDTIVYLACSLALSLDSNLGSFIPNININDWSEIDEVLPHIEKMIQSIKEIALRLEKTQTPFLLQPIWKTQGKSAQLCENCLDVFVWSNAGFGYFIADIAQNSFNAKKITRQQRTIVWLFKMLNDIALEGRFNHSNIIDNLSFNTKNDKAFASSGVITNQYMKSSRLLTPIIKKSEIKNIILGGGQNLLSPERRFDAIIFNSPELFQ